jgi:hypothetical protein
LTESTLTRADLVARGIATRTAARWIETARREGRARRVPVAIGSGAMREAWAMVVRTSDTPTTSAPEAP